MAKGKLVYVRAKKEHAGDGALWPEKKRYEALTTFVATGSAGTYLSPAVDLASGDYAWFSKASV